MNERIKAIRKHLELNQTEFGARIGVKQGTIAAYENGSRVPLDTVVTSICREFGVAESWLRTGEGEMFIKKSRDHEIAAFVGEIMKGEGDMRRRFVSVLARLSMEEWELLEKIARQFVNEDENS